MKTLNYQSALQSSTTVLVMAVFSLVVLASYTGAQLSGNALANGQLIRHLHQFAGHGLLVLSILQVVVLFLGQKFRRVD